MGFPDVVIQGTRFLAAQLELALTRRAPLLCSPVSVLILDVVVIVLPSHQSPLLILISRGTIFVQSVSQSQRACSPWGLPVSGSLSRDPPQRGHPFSHQNQLTRVTLRHRNIVHLDGTNVVGCSCL